jgi:protoporphyrinogen/coproporphyrinogen III oxidase
MKRVAIIGGGISGLAAAFALQEKAGRDLEISLFEEKARLGGVIETEIKNGVILEGGPDCFLSKKPWVRDLCRRAGLSADLISTQETHLRSFIFRSGKMHPVPEGFYLMAPRTLSVLFKTSLLSFFGKLRTALDLLLPSNGQKEESIAAFIRRRLGREAFENIGQPMVGGIYGGDPDKLSLQATLPQFKEMELKYGSVIRGLKYEQDKEHEKASGPRYSLFLSLKQGMEQLVAAISKKLSRVKIYSACAVKEIRPVNQNWELYTQDGRAFVFDAVLFAVPAYAAAKTVRNFSIPLADALESIPYESMATVNLLYKKSDIPPSFQGMGFVVPKIENSRISACTYSSHKFEGRAPEDFALLRVFVGGALYRESFQLDDRAMEEMVKEELERIAGITTRPQFISIRRYPLSMPQYLLGHAEKVGSIRALAKEYPRLFFTGNAFEGIGIPDCVQQAEQRAAEMLAALAG